MKVDYNHVYFSKYTYMTDDKAKTVNYELEYFKGLNLNTIKVNFNEDSNNT